MITEINICSDATVLSYDSFDCLVPHASGSWAIIPTIVSWITDPYPAHLPNECKCKGCKVYFVSKPIDEKIPVNLIHFIKIGRFIEQLQGNTEVLKLIASSIESIEKEDYERE